MRVTYGIETSTDGRNWILDRVIASGPLRLTQAEQHVDDLPADTYARIICDGEIVSWSFPAASPAGKAFDLFASTLKNGS